MIRRRLVSMALGILVAVASLLIAQPALACSVCFGDPGSLMNQGVQAGVLVLLGVVGVVLLGLASVLLFWVRRASQLRSWAEAVEEASQAVPSASRAPLSDG